MCKLIDQRKDKAFCNNKKVKVRKLTQKTRKYNREKPVIRPPITIYNKEKRVYRWNFKHDFFSENLSMIQSEKLMIFDNSFAIKH